MEGYFYFAWDDFDVVGVVGSFDFLGETGDAGVLDGVDFGGVAGGEEGEDEGACADVEDGFVEEVGGVVVDGVFVGEGARAVLEHGLVDGEVGVAGEVGVVVLAVGLFE